MGTEARAIGCSSHVLHSYAPITLHASVPRDVEPVLSWSLFCEQCQHYQSNPCPTVMNQQKGELFRKLRTHTAPRKTTKSHRCTEVILVQSYLQTFSSRKIHLRGEGRRCKSGKSFTCTPRNVSTLHKNYFSNCLKR